MRIRSLLPLLLLLVATVAEAQFRTSTPPPVCTVECPAGPQGPQGPQGPEGPRGPRGDPGLQGSRGRDGVMATCPAIPDRDYVGFDFTVSALIEAPAPACTAYLMVFHAGEQAAYLIDLRGARYQKIPNFMSGHLLTAIEASRTDPEHLILKDRTGFWGWRWPTSLLPWQRVPNWF